MGRAARPLHDPGNHRSIERGSNLQAARRGGLMKPAKPAGERVNTAALTPSLGTRSPLEVLTVGIVPCRLRGPFHASLPKTKFAADSALEESGFEPLVPATWTTHSRPSLSPSSHSHSWLKDQLIPGEGPTVRIRFPPPRSLSRRCPPWPPGAKARLSPGVGTWTRPENGTCWPRARSSWPPFSDRH